MVYVVADKKSTYIISIPEVIVLQFLQFCFFVSVSVLKGAGSYFAFAIADRLIEIAYVNKGWWLICYGAALMVAVAGVWCIIESFVEFAEVVSGLGGDEG